MTYWQGKVAVVTGGSQGLGLQIARALAAEGAKTIIAARVAERLTAAADALQSEGLEVTPQSCDVTRQPEVDELIAETVRRHGRIDLLVNNAGRSMRGDVMQTTVEQFRDLIDLNFLGAVRCTSAAIEHLIASKGHIVNIGSLAAKSAAPRMGAYSASKFPLAAYSQQLRLEVTPRGVHVLLVCPGPIQRNDAGERHDESAGDLPLEARLPGGGVKLKGIPANWLAGKVLTACRKRRAELVVPGKAKLLFAIAQLSPGLGDWLVRKWT